MKDFYKLHIDFSEYEKMRDRAERAESQNAELLAMLEELEWHPLFDINICRFCGNGDGDGHTEHCKLGNLIKKARG